MSTTSKAGELILGLERAARAQPALSADGDARRQSMRAALVRTVVSRRRRRRAARIAAPLALAAALIALLWPAPAAGPERDRGAATPATLDVAVVRDDPTVLARCVVRAASPSTDLRVGDRELIDLLAAAGRPTGLIRLPDRVELTSDVTDSFAP